MCLFLKQCCFPIISFLLLYVLHPNSFSSEILGRDKAFCIGKNFHLCWLYRGERCELVFFVLQILGREAVLFAEVSAGRIQVTSCSFLLRITRSEAERVF